MTEFKSYRFGNVEVAKQLAQDIVDNWVMKDGSLEDDIAEVIMTAFNAGKIASNKEEPRHAAE